MNEPQKLSLRDTIAPKSDQLNYDDVASCSMTVRIVGLAAGSEEQPVIVRIVRADNGTPLRDYKPCKSMRRVMIAAWGDRGKDWIGKAMTLYGDARVVFGGVSVGGIRVSHVSGINEEMRVKLTTTRSKRADYIVKPLASTEPTEQAGAHVRTRAECIDIISRADAINRAAALKTRDIPEDNWRAASDEHLAHVAGLLGKRE